VRNIFWTEQSRSDLAAIHAFIAQGPRFATLRIGCRSPADCGYRATRGFPRIGPHRSRIRQSRGSRDRSTTLPNRLPLGGHESDPHLDASSRVAAISVRALNRQPNTQMEPTRLTVCAIMSPRRAAHFGTFGDDSVEDQYSDIAALAADGHDRDRVERSCSVKKINAAWHKTHRMPRSATDSERLRWHLEHQKHCGCRPVPARLVAIQDETVRKRRRRKASADDQSRR
jgi:hypothetical protein